MQVQKSLVKFAPKGENGFYDVVKQRVEAYFEVNGLTRYADNAMRIKTFAMLALYFVPFFIMVSGLAAGNLWFYYSMWILMGLGIVGIGASVMHDSNHGAYSGNKRLNNLLGNVLNILGGYSHNWKIQHNILHHTYTNLEGLDEDIDAGILLRMSPHKPRYGFHRFQHLYAWFLYMIMNLFWVTIKDYRQLIRYEQNGMLKKQKISLRKALWELSLLKVVYIAYVIVLPILFSGVMWYHVLLGFVIMQVIAGLALACIFQPAHVMETSTFPDPPEDRRMEDNWAVHQLRNTTNFCPNSVITSWFIGGLNYQIEHHLFPHICHIHYPKIAPIVATVAKEFQLPYNVLPTFAHALYEHGRMLKVLGRPD